MIHEVESIIDGQPTFRIPLQEILSECKVGGCVQVLDPLDYHTKRQRDWYKGVCLPALVKWDENKEPISWWDDEVKKECNGLAYLKKEIYFTQDYSGQKIGLGRLTTKGVGKKNMTMFIEAILSKAVEKGWPVVAPDKELRKC